MAANTSPIFLKTPKVNFTLATSANTDLDGTGTLGTDIYLAFTADATNGSKIEQVVLQHKGTNSSATAVRFFLNNGSANTTATNNVLVHEETMAANTLSQTAASIPVVWSANLPVPAGYRLLVSIGTAASAGIHVTAIGGDY